MIEVVGDLLGKYNHIVDAHDIELPLDGGQYNVKCALKGSGRISEAKGHVSKVEKALTGDECRLFLIRHVDFDLQVT